VLLDALGLTRKDSEGYRLRTDNGQRLVVAIEAVVALMNWPQQLEMVAQQWRRIGIYADIRNLERGLAYQRLNANQDQLDISSNAGTELMYLYPRHCLPVDPTEAHLGVEIAKWYASNGTQGIEPADPELKRALELFRSAAGQQEQERNRTAQEIWKILVEQQYSIGTVGLSPAQFGVRIVSRRLGNIPGRACIAQHCRTPGTSHPEVWYFKA
jgi:peptide/nickel transport system substrate-binding protein